MSLKTNDVPAVPGALLRVTVGKSKMGTCAIFEFERDCKRGSNCKTRSRIGSRKYYRWVEKSRICQPLFSHTIIYSWKLIHVLFSAIIQLSKKKIVSGQQVTDRERQNQCMHGGGGKFEAILHSRPEDSETKKSTKERRKKGIRAKVASIRAATIDGKTDVHAFMLHTKSLMMNLNSSSTWRTEVNPKSDFPLCESIVWLWAQREELQFKITPIKKWS